MIRYYYSDPTAKELSGTGDLYHIQFSKTSNFLLSAISSDSHEYQDKYSSVSMELKDEGSKSDLVKNKIDRIFVDYFAKKARHIIHVLHPIVFLE